MTDGEAEFSKAVEEWSALARDFMEREREGKPTGALKAKLVLASRAINVLAERHGIELDAALKAQEG